MICLKYMTLLKWLKKYKLKFKEKPWISSSLQKFISIKTNNKIDPHIKEEEY